MGWAADSNSLWWGLCCGSDVVSQLQQRLGICSSPLWVKILLFFLFSSLREYSPRAYFITFLLRHLTLLDVYVMVLPCAWNAVVAGWWCWSFSQVARGRTRANGLKLCQGWFRLDIRESFFPGRALRHLNRLPRAVFKSCVDVLLTDLF